MARQSVMMTFEGDKDLIRALDRLDDKAVRRVVRPAISKAMTPMLKDARRRAKEIGDNETISKSLGRRSKTYRGPGTTIQVIGPRKGFKDEETGHNPANTAHLSEFGTSPHITKPGVRHPGTKPVPFMRPAFDSTRAQSLKITIVEVRKNLLKVAKR